MVEVGWSSFIFQNSAGISSGPGDFPLFIAFIALPTSGSVIWEIEPVIGLFF